MNLPLRRLIGVGALLSVLLTSCTGGDPATEGPSGSTSTRAPATESEPFDPQSDEGGTLRIALRQNPASIDPRFVVDEEGALVVDALFEGLVAMNGALSDVVPAAAESWTISDDGTVYEFVLRSDGQFHDGTPVTAEDFARSFRRMTDGTADPASFSAYKLEAVVGFEEAQNFGTPLSGVEAVDEQTLRITLQYPFAEFLRVLADPTLVPVPAVADEDLSAFAESPVGNGPFEMAEPVQQNQFLRLRSVPDHHAPPKLDELLFQIYTGQTSSDEQYQDFQDGLLDVAEVPDDQVVVAIDRFGESADGFSGPGVLTGVTSTLYYFGFNTEQPPFDDPAVRRAISQLIDRETIVEQLLRNTRAPAKGLVPPSLPGGGQVTCSHCDFDPDSAVAALVGDDGESTVGDFTLLHNAGETNQRIADEVAATIGEALGITVAVESVPLAEFVQKIRAGEAQMFRYGWTADYPSPGSFLLPQFRTETRGSDNLTNFSDEQVDQLLREARGESDTATRLELYQQAEELILEAAPVAPVFFYRLNLIVADEVRDLAVTPLGRIDFTRVWLAPEE